VLHRVARDLCLLLAPVLPFTTDEAWPLVPGLLEPSVHVALFPAPEKADDALLSAWAGLLDTRGEVMKALEDARAAKQVAASLEAAVVLRGPAKALAPLRAHEARGRVFPGNLANLFIVSAVRLEETDAPLAVSVEHAPGRKCERCWTWSPAVGTLPVHPGVCERCATVLARP
jgi:isoleucyl-tRNA synthetase